MRPRKLELMQECEVRCMQRSTVHFGVLAVSLSADGIDECRDMNRMNSGNSQCRYPRYIRLQTATMCKCFQARCRDCVRLVVHHDA